MQHVGQGTPGAELRPQRAAGARSRAASCTAGSNIPALRGWYVFGDYCSGEIWAIPSTAGAHASKTLLRNTSFQISSFGESAGGELFVVDLGGTIYRIDHA